MRESGNGDMHREKRRGYCGHKETEEAHHSRRNRRGRRRPADDRVHPAKQKTPDGAKSATKVRVFAPGLGNCGAKFREGQRAEDREQRANNPSSKDDRNETPFTRHLRWLQENAGADHGADDNRRRGPWSKTTHQFQTFFVHVIWHGLISNECRPTCLDCDLELRMLLFRKDTADQCANNESDARADQDIPRPCNARPEIYA